MNYRAATPAACEAVAVVMKTLDSLPIPDRLLALRSLAVLLGTRRAGTVLAARADGLSWAEIADRLGMSRQSVWDRYRVEAEAVPVTRRGRRSRSSPQIPSFSNCAAYKAVTTRPPQA